MKRSIVCLAISLGLGLALPAAAQKKYDPGASDGEIKIGNTNPYSGPASAAMPKEDLSARKRMCSAAWSLSRP